MKRYNKCILLHVICLKVFDYPRNNYGVEVKIRKMQKGLLSDGNEVEIYSFASKPHQTPLEASFNLKFPLGSIN